MVDISSLYHHIEAFRRHFLQMVKARNSQFFQRSSPFNTVNCIPYFVIVYWFFNSQKNLTFRISLFKGIYTLNHRITVVPEIFKGRVNLHPCFFFIAKVSTCTCNKVKTASRAIAVNLLIHSSLWLMSIVSGRRCIIVCN